MRFYFIRQAYSAQIEAWALLGMRIGYTCFGLALWPPRWNYRPWWIPHFRLTLLSHTGICNRYAVFRVTVGRRRFGFVTRGDAPYPHAGFRST